MHCSCHESCVDIGDCCQNFLDGGCNSDYDSACPSQATDAPTTASVETGPCEEVKSCAVFIGCMWWGWGWIDGDSTHWQKTAVVGVGARSLCASLLHISYSIPAQRRFIFIFKHLSHCCAPLEILSISVQRARSLTRATIQTSPTDT